MRCFIRVDKEVTIRYNRLSLTNTARKTSSGAKTVNFGVCGICFHGADELSVDEQLVVELRLPTYDAPITPLARVIWCRPREEGYDVGLELEWFDWQADEQLIFARYIHENHNGLSQPPARSKYE